MRIVKFVLKVWCITDCEEGEEVGEVEVQTLDEVYGFMTAVKSYNKNKYKAESKIMVLDKKTEEQYEILKELVEVYKGSEVYDVSFVDGLVGRMESSDGVSVEIELNDNSGATGSHKIEGDRYDNHYRNLLSESKKLAVQIVRL